MGLFSRKSSSSNEQLPINPRTGRPIRSDREFWTDLAADARGRAARADSKEGRKAMEKNARDFEKRARKS
ncbi:hypothetical protein ACGF3K_14465 [Streptomyces sp. NPDC047980]|uniref:hypothetical protein n=1 Tax=Streptomyces sp. NPDC047980 TaxID=3365494 RepID=UPI00371CBF82